MRKWLFEKRWRIILSGMIIIALPIIALSSFVYFVLIGHIRETVIEIEKNTAIETAHHIQDRVQDDIRAGKLIAARPLLHKAIKSADRKELTSRLKSFVENVVTIERVFINTPKAITIANYTVALETIGKDFSDRDWYKGVSRSWQPYVSEFYLRASEPKRYLFAIAIPIKTEKQEVVGILVLQPKADYIKNALSHMPLLKGQKVYLVDKKGSLIYHSDYTVDKVIDLSGISAVKKGLKGEEGIETIKQDGVSMVTAYYPIKEYGWGVVVQRPEKEVFGHIRKITLALFVFGGVMLVIGAYFATRRSDLLFKLRRLSDELEERVRELEDFSYSVSHDLKAPLRAIDGFSQTLIEDYKDRLDEEGLRRLNIVSKNARKMGRLIEDILAYIKLGKVKPVSSEVDMEGLVHEVWDRLKQDVKDREIKIEIKPLLPAYGDKALIRQVFVNLIANAIKFTGPMKSAMIEIGAIHKGIGTRHEVLGEGAEKRGTGENPPIPPLTKGGEGGFETKNASRFTSNEVVYYVKDNGVGFDMQYADKLFGVFLRLHGMDEFEGTGIGLAIVKRIIEKHGGRVWAEGRVGEGACFYFALPRVK